MFSVRLVRTRAAQPRTYGVVVPVRVAKKATSRNRIRRCVSELIRRRIANHLDPSKGFVVVTVRNETLPDPAVMEQELMSLLKKSGILTI